MTMVRFDEHGLVTELSEKRRAVSRTCWSASTPKEKFDEARTRVFRASSSEYLRLFGFPTRAAHDE